MSHSNDNNSNNNNSAKFSFNVDLKNPSEFTKVTIFDSNDRIQASDYSRTSTRLPRGLYTVRAEMDGHMEEKVVRHAGDSNIQIDTPGHFSSALISGFRTSHEYYTAPAVNWSKKNTTKSFAHDKYDNGGIFVFLRYATGDIFKKLFTGNSIGAQFSLEDHRGNRVCTFTPGFIKEDLESGWLAFSTDVTPGLYFIRYSGSVPRMIPLYIYQGWQTQVFLTLHRQPLFSSMRIFMKWGRGFEPDDHTTFYVDAALRKLQNADYYLPPDLMHTLVQGKFENPILGILGAYIYLKGSETKKDHLFQVVVQNLEHNILQTPDSPDVQALKLLAALHFKQPLPELRFDTPPMIRLGMETIIEQSGLVRSLVPEESLLDRVSPNRYADMPWTSWKPVAVEDDELEETGDDPAISQAKLLGDDGGGGAYDVDNVTGIDGSGSMKSLVDELSVRGFDEEDSCDDISRAGGSRGVVSAGFVSRGGGGRPRTFRFGPRVGKNRRLTYRGINLYSKKSERVNESHEKSIPIVTDKRFYKLIDWVTISLINALLKRSTDKRPVDIGSLAKELRVTPGTVKRTIRKLEKHLSNREGFKEALIELLAERHDLEIEKNQLDSLHASYIFYKISLEP